MKKIVAFKNSRGQTLTGVLHKPAKATAGILLCHGFQSTKDTKQYVTLATTLHDAGFAVLRFDFSGSGKSQGKFEDATITHYLDDTQAALTFLKKQKITPIGLYGSSLGGMVAVLTAAQHPAITSLIVRAPVSDFKAVWDRQVTPSLRTQWKKKKIMAFARAEKKYSMNYQFYNDGCAHNVSAAATRITCPTLIIHGKDDDVVPLEQSWELMKTIPGARIEVIEHTGHSFNDTAMTFVRNLAVEWFRASLRKNHD